MKIGIVGAGQVGATAAYSMMMRRVGSEITLVDSNADLAVAQARDILDATPLPIRSGSAPKSFGFADPPQRLRLVAPSRRTTPASRAFRPASC